SLQQRLWGHAWRQFVGCAVQPSYRHPRHSRKPMATCRQERRRRKRCTMKYNFATMDDLLTYVELRMDRALNEYRYRARRMLQEQGATKAEVDAEMECLEIDLEETVSDALATMR